MRYFLMLCCTLLLNMTVQAQQLPKVFNITNQSELLEQLSASYPQSLFNASETNIEKMLQNWNHVLNGMEAYAESIDFDLKGVRVWLKICWAKDGQIDHIVYYLLDESINIDLLEFEAFLRSFMLNYRLPIKHKTGFAYDARLVFPLYLMR